MYNIRQLLNNKKIIMKEKNEEEEIMKPSKITTLANFFFLFRFQIYIRTSKNNESG